MTVALKFLASGYTVFKVNAVTQLRRTSNHFPAAGAESRRLRFLGRRRVIPRIASVVAAFVLSGCSALRQKYLFYPTHHALDNRLASWQMNGQSIGFCRNVPSPKAVWLLLHGNGGQASDRVYALPSFAADDAVYILEYPGYGARAGTPSRDSFNAAARDAYTALRQQFPRVPVCVAGESIGSGPACVLALELQPPDKIVLVVPFDTLTSVAHEHVPYLPVNLLLGASWDNIAALSHYQGPVEIFGAEDDAVIPIHHAEALSRAVPHAKFHRISGGHNDWSRGNQVEFRCSKNGRISSPE